MKCEIVNIKRRRVCFGDLNRQIILNIRSIDAPETPNDFDYGQVFTVPTTVWAAIQTTNGKELFDGVNLIGTVTHIFYIKYVAGLTSESFVEYDSRYFRMLRLENLDENNEYMALLCTERGDKTIEVNKQ
jgi:SPP1 family predicted phage head-tail adaptor